MAQKTYAVHKKNLALSRPGLKVDLYFIDGKLTTSNEEDQKFIESLPSFKDETIWIESAPVDVEVEPEVPADVPPVEVPEGGVVPESVEKKAKGKKAKA